jgi:hypothetical protein
MEATADRELVRFHKYGITLERLEETWERCKKCKNFKRFKIIEGKVYGPDTPLKTLLKELVKRYRVPDVDFIYYQWDVIRKDFFKESKHYAPIFVSARDKALDRVVLFIDWYYDIACQDSGWNALIRSINKNQHRWPWNQKINQLFWRGGVMDGSYTPINWMTYPRGRLVYESKVLHTEAIDAAFVGLHPELVADPRYFIENNYTSSHVDPVDQLQYKYLIDVDGVTCTFSALPWKLLSGSVVMKQKTSDIMWFYKELIPWKHYIPLEKDLSDLQEKLLWALHHDREVKEIARNGREFALSHLMPEHILQYCYKILVKYASLQQFQPTK